MKKIIIFWLIILSYASSANAQYRLDVKLASGLSDIWVIETHNTYEHYIPSLSYSAGLQFSYALHSKYGLHLETKYLQVSTKQKVRSRVSPRFKINYFINQVGGYYYIKDKICLDLNLTYGIFLDSEFKTKMINKYKWGISTGALYDLNETFNVGLSFFVDITPYAQMSNVSAAFDKNNDRLYYINGINLVVSIKLFDKANKE